MKGGSPPSSNREAQAFLSGRQHIGYRLNAKRRRSADASAEEATPLAKTAAPTERQAVLAVPHLSARSQHFLAKTGEPAERQAVQAY
ncbi:MAG: hypothetical protein E7618_03625 [Ruminococcaceae bacterium]|nr:hypothetical protein [Oscillospiraceae bacterium]